jgi:hypothetical protein
MVVIYFDRVRVFKNWDVGTLGAFEHKSDSPMSSSDRQPPALATVARGESFAAAARRTTVGSRVFRALFD